MWPKASWGPALVLGGLLPHAAQSQRTERCLACVPEPVRDEVAVGFDLAPSYGASAAYFHNGSSVDLAKVPASFQYRELMMSAVEAAPIPRHHNDRVIQRCTQWVIGLLQRLGFHTAPPDPSEAATLLVDLISKLKEESEAALGQPITRVSVTAPWLRKWQDDYPDIHPINEALLLSGLTPFSMDPEEPVYITETQAILAANGHQLCEPFGSYRYGGQDKKEKESQGVFIVSYTEDTIYTGIESAECFYNKPKASSIRGNISTGELFPTEETLSLQPYSDIIEAIFDRVMKEFSWYHEQNPDSDPTGIIVLAGEGGDLPLFQYTMRGMARGGIIANAFTKAAEEKVENWTGYEQFKVVQSANATFAAARGAAMWSRLRLEAGHYCVAAECGRGRPKSFSPLDGIGEESCAPATGFSVDDEDVWIDI